MNEHELIALEQFSKLVLPPNQISQQLDLTTSDSADHMFNLIEGKNKQIGALNAQIIGASFTYADLKKLFDRIFGSAYWKKREETAQVAANPIESAKEEAGASSEIAQTAEPIDTNDQINQLNINMEDQLDLHKQPNQDDAHSNLPIDQGIIKIYYLNTLAFFQAAEIFNLKLNIDKTIIFYIL